MKLDFLEIGTSNFKTLLQSANDESIGISIEPIKYYLDQLPNKKNIKKINCAISVDNIEQEVEIFYIPEHVIEENKLNPWLRGCNSIGKYHPQHTRLSLEKFVVKEKVKEIPISKILKENNVTSIEILKIDTEGSDCYILKNLEKYLKEQPYEFYPNKIIFETNSLTPNKLISEVIEIYINLGYIIEHIGKEDTILKKVIR